MIQTINVSDFRAAFHSMGRKDQFSYEGLGALFDYLEDFDGGNYELDVIALCCDYSEETVEQIAENYGLELPADETQEEHENAVRDYLKAHTSIVTRTTNGFVYAQF